MVPEKIVDYSVNSFRVTPQWQIPGVLLGALTALEGYQAVKNYKERRYVLAASLAAISITTAFIASLCESGVGTYLKKYKGMNRILLSHGWDERVVLPHLGTYCGKRSARYAAIDSDNLEQFNAYLESQNKLG